MQPEAINDYAIYNCLSARELNGYPVFLMTNGRKMSINPYSLNIRMVEKPE